MSYWGADKIALAARGEAAEPKANDALHTDGDSAAFHPRR